MAERILIVDDEEELLNLMKGRLSSLGYDVVTANNGQEAVSLVRQQAPDAIILDIMMPQMDGLETLRQIRGFNKEIPVLMLTAYSDEENIKASNKLSISGFIPKNSENADISGIIKTVLRGIKSSVNK